MTATDFNELVVLHSDFLKPYAISLTRDSENAKDLFQETIFKALLNREKYHFGTNLKAWLHTIMRNIFINGYRRNKKYNYSDNLPAAEAHLYGKGNALQNNGISRLQVAEIEAAINDLPHVFRIAFELHYTGYKYQEIADLLKEPLGTVKSRIHFARKLLMAKLER
ncbi:MAG: RNA polymerase subunit sigma [Bacteroidetes bacterium 46-16]|mgnify:CR=1 FL=1|nr:MAG: RNA polymerase subunit sigma [Bacteroidetes bacterium 46-16]